MLQFITGFSVIGSHIIKLDFDQSNESGETNFGFSFGDINDLQPASQPRLDKVRIFLPSLVFIIINYFIQLPNVFLR